MEQVTFITQDGVTISGDYLTVPSCDRVALLLHMMPATRVSYRNLQNVFEKKGICSMAIDLRGHGQSTQGLTGSLNYQNFSDADHQKSRLDLDASIKFLEGKGFSKSKIGLVGASIGANLALDALARYPELRSAVLLSPGLDYRGFKADLAVSQINSMQKVWFTACEDDEYSADSARKLHALAASSKLTVFGGGDHGTNMFEPNKTLMEEIISFIFPSVE